MFLNDQEVNEVNKFLDNPVLVGAVKKVLLQDIYSFGTLEAGISPDFLKNFALSLLFDPRTMEEYAIDNGRLGEKLRACLEGIRLVQIGFNKLETFKIIKESEVKKENPAR